MNNLRQKINLRFEKIEDLSFIGKYKKILPVIVFVVASIFVFKFLDIDENLVKRPRSIHSWAQCMRASIAENYYEESMNFFLPRLHNVLDGEGITGLEFPFVNYSVAILYKLFGFNEAYFRGFVYFSLFVGLFFFFLLSQSLLKNILISLLVVGLCFFSPVLVYYSTNFMPDVTSLGLLLTSWFLFFKYLHNKKTNTIYWLFFTLTLASLIKITAFIAFGVLICLLILDSLKFFKKTTIGESLIFHKKHFLILIITGACVTASWYIYAQWLSKVYHSNAFTLGSEYVTDPKKFMEIWDAILVNWGGAYYNPDMYSVLLYMLVALILFCKYASRLLFSITIITILGSVSFSLLMFFQFRNHDYYIILLLPCVFFLVLTFFDLVIRLSKKFFMPIKYVVTIILIFTLYDSAIYSRGDYMYRQSDYYLDTTKDDFRKYYDLEPKLREWGIKKHDITFVGTDYTYCNGLYLMNQVGYQFSDYNPEFIKGILELKPRVLVLTDTAAFNKAYPNDFKSRIVGSHNGLVIYKLY